MPGVKCGSCSKFMSPADGAKCSKCSNTFHRLCVFLPQTGTIASSWLCRECKKRPQKDSLVVSSAVVTETSTTISPQFASVPAIQSTFNVFETELRRIREELRAVRTEFQAFREEMVELRALNTRVASIEERLGALEQCNRTQSADSSPKVDEVIAQLKQDLNDRDQDLLSNDVEISNLPENSGENLTHVVRLIATKLGVTLEDRDIVSVDRPGSRYLNATDSSGATQVRPRPIVVRLARRELRDALIRGARVRRGASTEDLGLPGQPRRLFIYERLTKSNRWLFRIARKAGQESGWKFIWTNRGRIFARRGQSENAHRIRCEDDLSRIFGTSARVVSPPINA